MCETFMAHKFNLRPVHEQTMSMHNYRTSSLPSRMQSDLRSTYACNAAGLFKRAVTECGCVCMFKDLSVHLFSRCITLIGHRDYSAITAHLGSRL